MSRIQKDARRWLAPAASRMLHALARPRTAVRGGIISLQPRHAQPQHGFPRGFAPAILRRMCSTSGESTHNMSACTMLSESEKDLRDSVEVFAREVLGPKVAEMDSKAEMDKEVLSACFNQGLMVSSPSSSPCTRLYHRKSILTPCRIIGFGRALRHQKSMAESDLASQRRASLSKKSPASILPSQS